MKVPRLCGTAGACCCDATTLSLVVVTLVAGLNVDGTKPLGTADTGAVDINAPAFAGDDDMKGDDKGVCVARAQRSHILRTTTHARTGCLAAGVAGGGALDLAGTGGALPADAHHTRPTVPITLTWFVYCSGSRRWWWRWRSTRVGC
jgi:hypothetical protein